METAYEPASQDDVAELLEMMEDFYSEEGITFIPSKVKRLLQILLKQSTAGLILVVRGKDFLRAYCIVTFGFSMEFGGRFLLLDELFVRHSERGAGLGNEALRAAERVCRQEGIDAVRLEVARSNIRALALYEKAGFISHGREFLTCIYN